MPYADCGGIGGGKVVGGGGPYEGVVNCGSGSVLRRRAGRSGIEGSA